MDVVDGADSAGDNGRKRHIIVDTLGLLLIVHVTPASVQDRDGARPALEQLRALFATISLVWAYGAYAGTLIGWARHQLALTIEVVKRSDDISGFVVLPRRWVVERTLSWITRRRRCVRDYERLPEHHEAMVTWFSIPSKCGGFFMRPRLVTGPLPRPLGQRPCGSRS